LVCLGATQACVNAPAWELVPKDLAPSLWQVFGVICQHRLSCMHFFLCLPGTNKQHSTEFLIRTGTGWHAWLHVLCLVTNLSEQWRIGCSRTKVECHLYTGCVLYSPEIVSLLCHWHRSLIWTKHCQRTGCQMRTRRLKTYRCNVLFHCKHSLKK